MNPTLFYIHDPMCSWCYAFETRFCALQKTLPVSIQVIRLVGGLAPDTIAIMPLELQKNIQQIWRRIEQSVPNTLFNYDFWMINTPIRSTYPACRAVLAAKKQGANFEDKMINAIQAAYYQKAKNPSLQSTLLECAAEIGLDISNFAHDLLSSDIEAQLHEEISRVRSFGISSFPSLRLEHNGRLLTIAVDYINPENMLKEIKILL